MGEKSRSKGWCGWFLVLVILALVVGAVVITVRKKKGGSDEAAPVPGPPGATVKKYADALKIAMQFFDVQKCEDYSLIPFHAVIVAHCNAALFRAHYSLHSVILV